MEELIGLVAVVGIFVVLPFLVILHYVTKWKTAPRLTDHDEVMLEELYQVARRLDERMDTVERLVASDHPEFGAADRRQNLAVDNQALDELERLRAVKGRTRR
jgi:phage shock protein B